MVRDPLLTTVAITDLRPTQITVGMREVKAKRKHWEEIGLKKGGRFLGSHMVPVILGPKKRNYVIDHHHLALALHEEKVKNVAVTVIANSSSSSRTNSGTCMDNRSGCTRSTTTAAAALQRHSEIHHRTDRRSVPFAGRRTAAAGRLCQGHDAVQRIHLGGISAPPHQAQDGRERLRRRPGKGAAIGQIGRRRLSAGLVRAGAGRLTLLAAGYRSARCGKPPHESANEFPEHPLL